VGSDLLKCLEHILNLLKQFDGGRFSQCRVFSGHDNWSVTGPVLHLPSALIIPLSGIIIHVCDCAKH